MKLSIKFDGEVVRKGLEDLKAQLPKISRQRIRTVMNRIVRRMQQYPSERPKQKYRRTGNFFYHWKIEEIDRGYSVENTAQKRGKTYGQYVVGDAYGSRQAWMHAGRWPVFRDVVDEEMEKLPEEIEDDIQMVARRNNIG